MSIALFFIRGQSFFRKIPFEGAFLKIMAVLIRAGYVASSTAHTFVIINQDHPAVFVSVTCPSGTGLFTRGFLAMIANLGRVDPGNIWVCPHLFNKGLGPIGSPRYAILLLTCQGTALTPNAKF